MDESNIEVVARGEVTPPAKHLLAEQRSGLALVLLGSLLVLLVALPFRSFFRPVVPVTRLPQREFEFQVDLNHANWVELVQLPGIGPSLAERILEDRQRNGRFAKRSDLGRVRGIGPQILERVLPFVAVQGEGGC